MDPSRVCLVAKGSGLPIGGAVVRVGDESVRTGSDGLASFFCSKANTRVEVLDDSGKVIAQCSLDSSDVVVEIDPSAIAGSSLSVGAGAFVLAPSTIPQLRAAALRTSIGVDGVTRALDRLSCALPPIASIPGLIELGRGVLLGRARDLERFRDELDQLAAWNVARLGPRDDLSESQAVKVLGAIPKQANGELAGSRGGDVPFAASAAAVLTAAAAYAGAPDPVAIVRNVQTIFVQLRALGHLSPLMRAARRVDEGPREQGRFMRMFAGYAGLCPDFGAPGELPVFPFPHVPDWHAPTPRIPDIRHHCPEAAAAIAEAAAAGMLRFRVTDVSPARACPGDEVTFTIAWTGSGPRDVDVAPTVGFRGLGAEAARLATATGPITDGRFTVVVPAGALCGPLEISVPTLPGRRVCGVDLDPVHAQQDGEVVFLGGMTYVRRLTHDAEGCVHAGDAIELAWEACNADSFEVTTTLTHVSHDPGSGSAESSVEMVDGTTYRAEVPAGYPSIGFTVTAIGPCGRHSRSVRFGIGRTASSTFSAFPGERFENWYGNQVRPVIGVNRPTSLDELVDAVRTAERLNVRLGVTGSRWSYSDCVVARGTPLMVDIAGLNRVLTHVLPHALLERRFGFASVLNARTINTLDAVGRVRVDLLSTSSNALRLRAEDRLVHVEAGINLIDLNCWLDSSTPPRALATLGGSNGQTLAGAINTSTHGANADMPPIPDLVRAIHLVGPGGKQWWIEPDRMRITDESAMRELMSRGVLDPCLELRYDDALFDAALVSMGRAGVVYSYVVEVVQRHVLQQDTTLTPWPAVRQQIRDDVLAPGVSPPWVLEISMNPTTPMCWVTTRSPSRLEVDPRTPPSDGLSPVAIAALGTLFGLSVPLLPGAPLVVGGALGAVLGGFGVYFARRTAELIRIFTNPFEWWRIGEVERELRLMEQMFAAIEDIIEVVRTAVEGGDAEAVEGALADAMPHLLSVMWQVGFYGVDGRVIIDTIQNLFTNIDQRPPGTTRAKSYQIMTQQDDCMASGYMPPAHTPPRRHPPLIRLIHSQEYIVPADALIPFTDDVLEIARDIRDRDAFILIINLRFTQATRASLGIQQHSISGHIELWTIREMPGNEEFFERVQSLVDEYEAIPHWGHVHVAEDLRGRYPRHSEWAAAIDAIARADGNPNTFRDRFTRDRRLLDDLP